MGEQQRRTDTPGRAIHANSGCGAIASTDVESTYGVDFGSGIWGQYGQ